MSGRDGLSKRQAADPRGEFKGLTGRGKYTVSASSLCPGGFDSDSPAQTHRVKISLVFNVEMPATGDKAGEQGAATADAKADMVVESEKNAVKVEGKEDAAAKTKDAAEHVTAGKADDCGGLPAQEDVKMAEDDECDAKPLPADSPVKTE